MGYKRLALVDPRLIQATATKPISDKDKVNKHQVAARVYKEKALSSLNPQSALLQILQDSHKRLHKALYNEKITPEARLQKHKTELNKIQLLIDKNKYYLKKKVFEDDEFNNQEQKPVVSPKTFFTTKLMENIPKVSRSKIKRLLTALEQSGSIKWNANGNIISIAGNLPPTGSNIITLLNDISAFRKTRPTRPPGARQLQELIAQIDPDFNLVRNTLYHQNIVSPATTAEVIAPLTEKVKRKLPKWVN